MHPVRVLALSITGIAAAACHFGGNAETIDAGRPVERDVAIGAFQQVQVSGPFDVEIKADGQPGIHVTGGERLINETEFVVEGGTLKIRPKKNNVRWTWGDKDKVRVTVHGGGAIGGAAIAGSGDVNVDRVKTPSFTGSVAGSGDLRVAALETDDAHFSIAGSGDISAAGRARKTRMEIRGSGDIAGEQLVATDAEISIAGSGNIAAHATGTADVRVMGSGDVSVTGGAKCQVKKQGSGDIRCS